MTEHDDVEVDEEVELPRSVLGRAKVRISSVADAISPVDDPLVQLRAKTGQLEEFPIEISWHWPAALAPRHGEIWSVRLDWIDPNAQEENGVVLADEARAWIEAHPHEALGIAQDALGIRRSK